MKFWLEQLGYDVMLSELNDFPKEIDRNAYDACLQTIDHSDYFVLLIGRRVGGWFDKTNRVSITQMEYRRAYERLKDHKLKLIVFVRQDVWDIREDRKALAQYLRAETELDDETVSSITNHASTFVTDAKFIFDFLREVGRIDEMKLATSTTMAFPPGNWIHRFTGFPDIIDALRSEFQMSVALHKAALGTNLKDELLNNIQFLSYSRPGAKLCPTYQFASGARGCFKGTFNEASTYKREDLVELTSFLMFTIGSALYLRTMILDEAINSGEFLEFDYKSDSLAIGKMQRALIELKTQVEQTHSLDKLIDHMELIKEMQSHSKVSTTRLPNSRLWSVFTLHDRFANIVRLSVAIYHALDAKTAILDSVRLYSSIPSAAEEWQISEQVYGKQNIQHWVLHDWSGCMS